ncbi:hypothetical protein THASP1DRAFT_28306 [Thamnocephalis sphaerospora]|uniref:Ketoreductase domain-containing protein n=1 Tax=Thamnocephalis sphaerospora TaxID=78915 RepID=A0A4P9XUK6_9FUNG|nr:hypothetical protein THASP1DRAFT_28306 [Thamnocephalis sphaerospora]|eukprot:RKP09908.1 hypothetical protein THASP1DRAFT_28306 [Thamnocephalis sphaerospora]
MAAFKHAGTALVTGGTRGIGLATARLFAEQGYRVVVAGRNEAHLAAAQTVLAATVPATEECLHRAVQCDVQSDADVQALAKTAAELGNIAVVVNAAGITHDGLCVRTSMEQAQRLLDVNLLGTMRVCKALAPALMRQRHGTTTEWPQLNLVAEIDASTGCIVNLSSVVGLRGNTGQTAYAASKAGLLGYTRALAKELGPRGIRVNAIAPGFICTDMTRDLIERQGDALRARILLGRFGEPEEVADAALYLARASYVTGQTLVVDGGLVL